MIIEVMRDYLEERGVGSEEIAHATGIDQREIEGALQGESSLDFAQYALICRFLGVPIETFIEADEARRKK
ncbi:MAG: helix-turn-helix transcriptional regulator [Eggerthellaceae bacterium]|nr:helix-turn-helix transcriptional regulator [Eggerthellaceae bacterium]